MELGNSKTIMIIIVKWLWRIYDKENALYRQVIRAKYGMEVWKTKSSTCHGVCSMHLERHQTIMESFIENTIFNERWHSKLFSWLDAWIEHSTQKNQFPASFRNAVNQSSYSILQTDINMGLELSSNFSDWKMDDMFQLLQQLDFTALRTSRDTCYGMTE